MKSPKILREDKWRGKRMFAVFIRRKDGTEFIAHSGKVFFKRSKAHEFQNELKPHFKTVVRRVAVSITPLQ